MRKSGHITTPDGTWTTNYKGHGVSDAAAKAHQAK